MGSYQRDTHEGVESRHGRHWADVVIAKGKEDKASYKPWLTMVDFMRFELDLANKCGDLIGFKWDLNGFDHQMW